MNLNQSCSFTCRCIAAIILSVALYVEPVASMPPDRPISRVVKKGASYSIVGERGRRLAVITPPPGAEMIGFNNSFCMMRSGGEYLFYNSGGRQYLRLDTASLAGQVKAVSGYTFSAGNDSLTVTYGPDGKILSSRLHPPFEPVDSSGVVGQNAEKME